MWIVLEVNVMKILSELIKIMKKVERYDKKYTRFYKSNCNNSNPFSFTCGQTYAWVEPEEKESKNPFSSKKKQPRP